MFFIIEYYCIFFSCTLGQTFTEYRPSAEHCDGVIGDSAMSLCSGILSTCHEKMKKGKIHRHMYSKTEIRWSL